MAAPAYHARTHAKGGTDPLPTAAFVGEYITPTLVNGFTDVTDSPGAFQYRHGVGYDDEWILEFRGHIEGPSDTYAFVLPADDRPPEDKFGITEGEDGGDGIVVEWYIEAATGYFFITYPIGGGGGGGGGAGDYILIRDEKAANTQSGTFTSGSWQTRVLNTEVSDAGGHASLASNQITLAAGTYTCRISCPAWHVDRHKARLQNVTDATTTLLGTSEYTGNAAGADATRSEIAGGFTIASSKTFEVQHRCQTTQTNQGLGVEVNFGVTEVYAVAEFWKVA